MSEIQSAVFGVVHEGQSDAWNQALAKWQEETGALEPICENCGDSLDISDLEAYLTLCVECVGRVFDGAF